ncbi:retrotransposon hot spot (RHS) protein, putative, partial [Trypanosoma cruzi]
MKYTMSTNIEDVVFKGRVRVKEMELNDFLLMRFGGKGVVDTNRNVLLEDFFKEPARYILDEGVLNEIRASGAYARMERTVREEMDLEEAVRSLCENGVDFLEQWRDYEGKDTVTPLARRNLKRALTQVLREERREEVERARREGQVGFTLTTTIEGVLFKGRARVIDIKLNDFLTMELDGRGILRANQNVLLRDFFKEPASYIRDAEVLNEIQKKYYALKLESTVREEMELEEDVHQLQEKGVDNLFGWSRAAAEVKASVRDKIKNS